MQLQAFQQWIALLQQYGGKANTYQQQYTSDQQALTGATTDVAYQSALGTLNGHVKTIKLPALKTEANSLQNKLASEASSWENKHTYYDSYDGNTYNLGYEYAGSCQLSLCWPARERVHHRRLSISRWTIEYLAE